MSGSWATGCVDLKQCRCPHCGRAGTLNRHSRLQGNALDDPAGQSLRGQRAYCSRRGRRGGCGRTVSLFLSGVLPRHTLNAPLLWRVLRGVLGGASLQSVAQGLPKLPMALESLRGACRRLRRRLDAVRTVLCGAQAPPLSTRREPLHQTLEHLQAVFPHSTTVLEDYQCRFAQPFMG